MHQPGKLILTLILCFSFMIIGNAQENTSRSFFSHIYGDAQLGLLFTGDYNTGQFNANVGFRFDQHHSLGVGFYGFTEAKISTTRSARGFGLQYRYQLKRFMLDATAGRVSQYRFATDYYITPVIDEKQPSPWFYRFGLHYRTFMGLTYGVSFAWAKDFGVTYTDTEVTPVEIRHSQIRGGQVFTIDVGFLIQKNQ